MRRRPADDSGLWRRAVRDVAPLRRRPDTGRHRTAPLPTSAPVPPPAPSSASGEGRGGSEAGGDPRVRAPAHATPRSANGNYPGLDRTSAERLKRGRYPVDAVLDLHGLTQEAAHRRLSGFIDAARAAGSRCILVVTGQGRTTGGVLKTAVPRWLDEPDLRRHLLAAAPAKPQHGGGGALYLLLRRVRR